MLHHPFIVNMMCSFQDYENWYLVMDLLTGGDLRYHICHKKRFNEEQTKFFLGCVIWGLEYIHTNNVIHRDIKPENLVCDDKGYIAITDFGVAKRNCKDNSSETSGTPGYMAPEVWCAQNHSFPADFFALGVMGFEFMFGVRPYLGRSRKEIKEAVWSKAAHIHKRETPIGWSYEAVDFINSWLQRKPSHRLGYNGINEIKTHPWFNGFNWELLFNKKTKSPFQPKIGDNFDKRYCEGVEKIGQETQERYRYYMKKEKFSSIFLNYTHMRPEAEEYITQKYSENTTASTVQSTRKWASANFIKYSQKENTSMNNKNDVPLSPTDKTRGKSMSINSREPLGNTIQINKEISNWNYDKMIYQRPISNKQQQVKYTNKSVKSPWHQSSSTSNLIHNNYNDLRDYTTGLSKNISPSILNHNSSSNLNSVREHISIINNINSINSLNNININNNSNNTNTNAYLSYLNQPGNTSNTNSMFKTNSIFDLKKPERRLPVLSKNSSMKFFGTGNQTFLSNINMNNMGKTMNRQNSGINFNVSSNTNSGNGNTKSNNYWSNNYSSKYSGGGVNPMNKTYRKSASMSEFKY